MGREAFCRLADSKRRLYYVSTKGRILSISKKDPRRKRFLKVLSHGRVVVIMGHKVPVVMAMARAFYKGIVTPGTTVAVRFIDGNRENLNINNIVFFFAEEGGRGNETNRLDNNLPLDD